MSEFFVILLCIVYLVILWIFILFVINVICIDIYGYWVFCNVGEVVVEIG